MKFSVCNDCKARFLVPRNFCPECNSSDISERILDSGVVIYCVKLIATPEPFPDQYYLILAENSGLKFFCRSDNELEEGTPVKVQQTANGIVCTAL